VPSVRRAPQVAVLVLCGALGAGGLAGCETTQEKAAAQRARSERILEARAQRQAARKHHKQHAHGTKTGRSKRFSSRRQKGEG
jgi:regulator of protease activity HflC (stomatin/prohibitin superfamily)